MNAVRDKKYVVRDIGLVDSEAMIYHKARKGEFNYDTCSSRQND